MRVLGCLLLAACAGEASYGGDDGFGGTSVVDGGFVGCLSSNECPAGYICNDFGNCEKPPPAMDDAGRSAESLTYSAAFVVCAGRDGRVCAATTEP